ncbi:MULTISPECIES: HAMP domain-containing sensor histidine kinase [unclassified Pseudomonas]|uniref:sensor histidine kinase n=1 Tax=unclassified Pseudomonas TaxID=196821 RepID=UPI00088C787A|nr:MULTISPECIES: ATP-binding protein [unclassified Pseudomonas]SCZ12391.1 Histidine kinase-, DNA gyrase B-, and HSP90-like ATPase [Pseudomonas sp. NFACC37-1]SFO95440.1 Histidine kinase-, DNA gyrase B-, and HSP90-like ATPase [Pseudomonas sp. NFACC24-1]
MSKIEMSDLMERYRSISRTIQNDIQNCSRVVNTIITRDEPTSKTAADLNSTLDILENMRDAWGNFSSWMLAVTLDDLEEARKNCAPGVIDIKSKLFRSKKKIEKELKLKRLKIKIEQEDQAVINTYIPYFEQLLDLLIGNAAKYSNEGGNIDISYSRNAHSNGLIVSISSIGPMVEKFEIPFLCNDGYRGDKAKKATTQGQGKGLFIANKICDLIHAKLIFIPNSRSNFEISGVPYSNFEVQVIFPDDVPSQSQQP